MSRLGILFDEETSAKINYLLLHTNRNLNTLLIDAIDIMHRFFINER